jgi:hypothetical protein
VVAAVRVLPEPEGAPAQFVVVVDCGDDTPPHRYAVLAVCGWPDRVVAERGDYDLTLDRAQQIMLERARLLPTVRVEVVTVRDPDRANDDTVFVDGRRGAATVTDTGLHDTRTPDTDPGGNGDVGVAARVRVLVCDIDPGDTGVTPGWVREMLTRTGTLSPAAASCASAAVADHAEDNAIPLP